jgi:hypothetical protein
MRVFLIVLIVVGAALVVADFVVKRFAEDRMAGAAQSSLGLDDRPRVSVDAFPFLLAAARGDFSAVTVTEERLSEGEIVLRDTRLVFEDVSFSMGQLLSGERRSVTFGSAGGTTTVTEEDLTAAARELGAPVTVDFREGRAFVRSDLLDGEAAAEITLESDDLVVAVSGLDALSVDLPAIAPGVTYRTLRIGGPGATLTLDAGETTLEF